MLPSSQGLGKTTLVERFVTGKFISSVMETAGVDSRSKTYHLKGYGMRG